MRSVVSFMDRGRRKEEADIALLFSLENAQDGEGLDQMWPKLRKQQMISLFISLTFWVSNQMWGGDTKVFYYNLCLVIMSGKTKTCSKADYVHWNPESTTKMIAVSRVFRICGIVKFCRWCHFFFFFFSKEPYRPTQIKKTLSSSNKTHTHWVI